MFPILHLGPLAIQAPGLLLLAGLWVGLAFSEKEAPSNGLKSDQIYNLVLAGLIAGVTGARLAYVLRYASAYVSDPLGIVSLNPSTLAVPEGLMIGLTAMLVYSLRKKMPLRLTLDVLAPGIAVFMIGIAASHVASGDAFGSPARLPWSIFLWGEERHPSQFYELFAGLMILAAWWRLRTAAVAPGLRFIAVISLWAVATLWLEAFRGDSLIVAGGFRVTQLWALMVMLVCLGAALRWRNNVLLEATAA